MSGAPYSTPTALSSPPAPSTLHPLHLVYPLHILFIFFKLNLLSFCMLFTFIMGLPGEI
jgi:hypothetical protein